MANHIRHVICPGCQDRRLASFANRVWKRLIRDKLGNYLFLCGRCSQELATVLFTEMQPNQGDFIHTTNVADVRERELEDVPNVKELPS